MTWSKAIWGKESGVNAGGERGARKRKREKKQGSEMRGNIQGG